MLQFRPGSTPETYLDFSTTERNSVDQPSNQTARPPNRWNTKQPTIRDSMCPPSSLQSGDQRESGQSDSITSKLERHHGSRKTPEGKICLHTHHHHYWMISDTSQLQQATPRLCVSQERGPLHQVSNNGKFDGTMEFWPSEGDIEALTESRRPPSRNTNHRYFIEG